jgi:hypothetical protein
MSFSTVGVDPGFEHVLRLTDEHGLFEHADGIVPRREGGYRLDDVARALVVVCRQRPRTSTVDNLATAYLSFVRQAQQPDGWLLGVETAASPSSTPQVVVASTR